MELRNALSDIGRAHLACSEVTRWPVGGGLWRLLSTTRTYGQKRLDGDPQYEGPEEGPNFWRRRSERGHGDPFLRS